MTIHDESPAPAAKAALHLRLRQRQIGRELRLYYERAFREPLPADMIDVLLEADGRERTRETGPASSSTHR